MDATILAFTNTFDVELLGFPRLAAIIALGNWPPFPLDFEKCTIGVSTVRRSVAFDAGFTCVFTTVD